MNKILYKKLLCCACLISALFYSCKDPWKDRTEVDIQILNRTVLEEIATNPNLSKFHELLKKSGVDKKLQESRAFTVWAPTNTALENLDESLINDTDLLISFIENHIAYQAHFTKDAGASVLYISSLNGKKVRFQKNNFEDHPIKEADRYFKNGVIHLIDGVAIPRPNAFEYLQSLNNKQAKFIEKLNYMGLDVSKGVVLYYDPVTNEPVYQEGTTLEIKKNRFFEDVSNIASEDSLLTFIILNDSSFDYEYQQLADFNRNPLESAADSLTKWHIIKDLVINGVQEGAVLNDSLTSITGVKLKVNQEDIIETKRLSNGIAYVVNKLNYKMLTNKIPTIVIDGTALDSLRVPSTTSVKILKDFNNNIFRQLETPNITSSPSPLYYFRYKIAGYTTKYAVYVRARNTFFSVPFSMAVAFGHRRNEIPELPKTPYFQVPVYDEGDSSTLNEIDAGASIEVLHKGYNQYVYLLSSEGATSSAPTALAVNYIKLVPIN